MTSDALKDGDASDLDAIAGALPRKKFSGKKLVLFVVLPILLLGGGGAAAYFLGLFDALLGHGAEGEAVEEAEEPGQTVFMPLPVKLVNLNAGTSKKITFLKIRINLELASEKDRVALEAVLPRVMDSFEVYLRELRLDDLKGSAGMYRLREELLMRINMVASPVRVRDVLFEEFLVQ